MSQPKKNEQQPNKKRFVIVTGNKGGTGKSTFARALFDYYLSKKFNCIGYDSDIANPQLERHFAPQLVHCINIFQRGGADRLVSDLEESPYDLVLVDMGAQTSGYFYDFEKEVSFFDLLEELGYRVTMASVLSRVKDSVNTLDMLQKYCGNRVDHVIVKNRFFASEEQSFVRYDTWSGRQKMLDDGAKEIEIPDLFASTYDFIDTYNIGFFDGMMNFSDEKGLKITIGRIKSWLGDFEKNIKLANDYLGLNTPSMSEEDFNRTLGVLLDKSRETKKNHYKVEAAAKAQAKAKATSENQAA